MDHEFLDGIDAHFERLMKLNGNGRRSERGRNGSSGDRMLVEIMAELEGLTHTQKKQVLDFVRSLNGSTDQLDFSQSVESDPDQS